LRNVSTVFGLVLLVLLSTSFVHIQPQYFPDHHEVQRSGTADRVAFVSPEATMTADEVVGFEAVIYDAVNNIISGEVSWSASNGTISEQGVFYPWSSGVIEITAEHNGLQASHNITVNPGVATAIEITSLLFGAKEQGMLTADVIDGRGNRMMGSSTMVWDVDGVYAGHGTPSWTPEETGEFDIRVRFNQLEDRATIVVEAGAPYEFVFEEFLQVRAGTTSTILPKLVDLNGYEMPLYLGGSIAWFAENGTFNAQGEYFASNTGRWLITATAGNITGSTELHVIPGDAVASTLMFADEPETFLAGESYELVFERRDANGYIGFMSPAIETLTASSGGLSVDDELRVYWNPSSTGQATLTGQDGNVSSSFSVNVQHGNAIDIQFRISPSQPSAGDQVVIEMRAEDVKGNRWVVDGDINMTMGVASESTPQSNYVLLQAASARSWRFQGSWYDNSTGAMFLSETSFDVSPGRLAFITLMGDGSQVPADGELDLAPEFFDAFGNELSDIALNWTLDGEDITLDMLLNDGRWIASSLGGHELRVNAAGVFATVRVTVVVGNAHGLITDADQGLVVQAGNPQDVFIQVVDIHGNVAESTDVITTTNNSIGELDVSPTGIGYWQFTGKIIGNYELVLQQSDAVHVIPLTVEAGDPIRIQAAINKDEIAEGDSVLLTAIGTDAYGNTISIPKTNTTVSCTAGDARFVTNGTWEVEVSTGGTDRSCTIRWNGLLAQTFFDVDDVLLGGAVGSTNTAVTMAAVLLCLLLAVLVVLTRKAALVDEEEWLDEVFDEDGDEDDEEEVTIASGPVDETPLHERHGLTLEGIKELAQEAGNVGVMQATPSTTQGETGWYVDVSEELQYWEVTPEGEWIRHE
jgi:hypothetical protein